MRATLLAGLVAACPCACACAPPAQQAVPEPVVDVDAYARDVHPILEARCGTLDCHGDMERPLRIYAETGLRRGDEMRPLPITVEELAENARAAVAIDPAAAAAADGGHLLLLKPLAVEAGGVGHVGGDVWRDRTDPQLRCVAGWLAGRSDQAEIAAACAIAAEEVRLPEP